MSFEDFAEKADVDVSPVERGFLGSVKEAYARGRDTTNADVAVYEAAAKGIGNEEIALRVWKDSREKERVDPIDGNWLADMMYGTSRIAGQWSQSIKKGGVGAVVFAGVGAVAGAVVGAVIPTIGEEPATIAGGAMIGVKAGMKFGFASGTTLHMYKQGTGAMYANMLEMGVDKDNAAKAAGIAGIPYALLEMAQVGTATGLAKPVLSKAFKKTSTRLAANIAKRYGATLGENILQEMGQEIVQIGAEDWAMAASDMGVDVDSAYLKARINRVFITGVESAKMMALLPLPGSIINASIENAVMQNVQEEGTEIGTHEGMLPEFTEEDFNNLGQADQATIQQLVDTTGMPINEAAAVIQAIKTPEIEQTWVDEKIDADNVTDAIDTIEAVPDTGKVLGTAEARTLKNYMKRGYGGLGAFKERTLRMRNIIRKLQGGEKGVLTNLISNKIRAANSTGIIKQAMFVERGQAKIDELGVDGPGLHKPSIEISTRKDKMRPTEAMEVYLATHDKGKLRVLKEGNELSDAEIAEIISKLSPEQKALADYQLEVYRDGHSPLAAIHKLLTGKELPQYDGYNPIILDEKSWDKTADYVSTMQKETDRRGMKKRVVKADRTKKRTGKIAPLRLDAMSNFLDYGMQTEWYKAVAVPVYKVGKIFNDKEFQKRVNAKTHGVGSKLMSKWLQDFASEQTTLETTWAEHMLNKLRQNSVVAALGFNVISQLRQPLSMSIALADDPRLITLASKNFALLAKDRKGLHDFVNSKSDLVRLRSMDRDLRNMARRKDAKAVWGKAPLSISKPAMVGIQWMDRQTVAVVWKSGYDLAMNKGVEEKVAIEYADKLVEKTQPMADIMDLPAFFRGSTLEKMFSTFQNQVNQNVNYWYGDIYLARMEGEIGNIQVGYRVLMSYFVPAMVMGLISGGFGPPEDPKEVVQDLAAYGVAPVFAVGSMASGMIQGYGVRMPIGFGMFEEFGKAATAKDGRKVIERVIGGVAQGYGLPWSQPKRTLQGIVALGDGETSDARRLIWNEYALQKESEGASVPSLSRRSSRGRRSRR